MRPTSPVDVDSVGQQPCAYLPSVVKGAESGGASRVEHRPAATPVDARRYAERIAASGRVAQSAEVNLAELGLNGHVARRTFKRRGWQLAADAVQTERGLGLAQVCLVGLRLHLADEVAYYFGGLGVALAPRLGLGLYQNHVFSVVEAYFLLVVCNQVVDCLDRFVVAPEVHCGQRLGHYAQERSLD